MLADRTKLWHLVQFKPNCAQIANRNLARQGFVTFLPLERQTKRQGQRLVTVKRPYFPGYLFVGVDEGSAPWRAIRSTQGVAHLVCFDNTPGVVPTDLVNELAANCDDNCCLRTNEGFSRNDAVQVRHGPFANLIGRVEQIRPTQRIWVLLDVLGSATRVSVGRSNLRKTNGRATAS